MFAGRVSILRESRVERGERERPLSALPPSARALIESAPLAHVVTLNADGSPQVTCVWVGLEGDQVFFASLTELVKIRNLRRDSRIVISIEAETEAAWGVKEYIVIYGAAEVRDGGGAAALQTLAHRYISPDVRFPDMEDPPDGYVVAVTVDRIRGVGPWMEGK
jgi:PPOX class probable F420-dependent enzyme